MKKGWTKKKLKKAIRESAINSAKLEGYKESPKDIQIKAKEILKKIEKSDEK